ncbi:MAG: hypothetical protein U0S50_04360 [Sphingopyxis sp.]|uniref:hypothetical protein n=1 Tax=Sphingopyxis sp. TaxID=1908224 RepID=UPI002AB966C0|nr:hypothetical protein [Sphingopyxis sp.]MDZ3831033.1 hypothetical protein [Sphingopyxis sp.]
MRPKNMLEKSRPRRAVKLGFVDLKSKGHDRPQPNIDYDIISAGSSVLDALPYPKSARQMLDIDVYALYGGDLPEGLFGGRNEGLLKIQAHTADPQNIAGQEAVASFVREFDVKDDQYAPGFLFSGVFRRILIEGSANIGIDLYEMDSDASEYYGRFKSVVDKVPEIKSIDVLKGIPYLSLATNLAEAVIDVFGKNPDDHIWGELPLLEIKPLIGGAFLRDGIYIIIEAERDRKAMKFEELKYRNNSLVGTTGVKLGAHLVFGLRLREYSGRA